MATAFVLVLLGSEIEKGQDGFWTTLRFGYSTHMTNFLLLSSFIFSLIRFSYYLLFYHVDDDTKMVGMRGLFPSFVLQYSFSSSS
jgi:hypothetical protein